MHVEEFDLLTDISCTLLQQVTTNLLQLLSVRHKRCLLHLFVSLKITGSCSNTLQTNMVVLFSSLPLHLPLQLQLPLVSPIWQLLLMFGWDLQKVHFNVFFCIVISKLCSFSPFCFHFGESVPKTCSNKQHPSPCRSAEIIYFIDFLLYHQGLPS